MTKNYRKYMPIGSVVLLKKATKKLVIIGYTPTDPSFKNKIYDYLAVPFPEGYVDFNKLIAFNHEDIADVYYLGYSDNETVLFNYLLHTFKGKYIDAEGNLTVSMEELLKMKGEG